MPIFAAGSPGYQSTVVGSATPVKIWSGTVAALGTFSSTNLGPQLRDITILNAGTATLWLNSGSAAAVASGGTTGLVVPAGAQLTIQGWTANAGTTTSDIWAIVQTNTGSTTAIAALASNAWVV